MTRVVDLFAGPGGWDFAARELGLDVLGIERDPAACRTRKAAGLPTIEGDVREHLPLIADLHPLGLIASPPCQTFSAAGNGAGRAAMTDVLLGVELLTVGLPLPSFSDERTSLVLEPLRWALEADAQGRPFQWIVLEQVPAVLPVWGAYAEVLRERGYSVTTGVLNAEQYGVPQTRRRAVLMARLGTDVWLPTPTHSRYHSRNPERLDPGVLPWVSMDEALEWGMTQRPYPTIACSSDTGGPDKEKVGGSAARAVIYREQATGRWRDAPAPSVNGDPRLAPRGCKHPAPGCCSAYPGTPGLQFPDGSVRVSIEEAATLQTFPDGYPWQGTKTEQFRQIGNAVPPLLACAILSAVLS